LREIYLNSPTNNAIINGMVEIIYGNGLDAKDKQRKPEAYAQMMSMFSEEDVRRVTMDLKQNGGAAFQVVYKPGKKQIERCEHFPVETLRAEIANEEGDIEKYYYSPDWAKVKQTDKLKTFPAFGFGSKTELNEIMFLRPYRSGFFYYSPVDYQGCTPYCELEAEVAQYHINNIKNGFHATTMINFHDGVPDQEAREAIERKITQKWGGANGSKIIVGFYDNKDATATVENFQLSEADKQYQFTADESTKKIMLGHRITSPILLGIKDNTGLGNNADELKMATMLFETYVLNTFRLLILRAVDTVLAFNGISLKTYFRSLSPWADEGEAETTQLSSQKPVLAESLEADIMKRLEGLGEPITALDEDYELENAEFAEDEDESADLEATLNEWANNQPKSLLSQIKQLFAVEDPSYQDTPFFKVRYAYKSTTTGSVKGDSRPLCNALTAKALMYRKEDIREMSSRGGAEAQGEQYDVFLHKGGANCQHGWERRVYKKKAKKDGTPWGGGAMNGVTKSQIYDAIRAGAKVEQAEAKKAVKAPRDTKTKGYKK